MRIHGSLLSLPALLLLASCSSGGDDQAAESDQETSSPALSDTSSSGTPSSGAPSTPASEEPPNTEPVGCRPRGSFRGPIVMRVTGKDLEGTGFSGGDGRMTVVVDDGKVTSGTWKVAWRSRGTSSSNGIDVTLDVRGVIAGTVSGTTSEPSLAGDWTLDGEAISDIAGTVPIHYTGNDTETMAVKTTTCDNLSGSFIASFNARNSGGIAFTGIAEWTGVRVD